MSRSNPHTEIRNPATKWFEWKGKAGQMVYYDKAQEQNIVVPDPFTFIFLDRLATVTGYNKKLSSGVYSNEVRDTRSDVLIVKYFNGTKIATGTWDEIKDTVTSRNVGGKFAVSVYLAYKEGAVLKLGAAKLSGSALGPWFDFEKSSRNEINSMGVRVTAGKRDDSGEVEFTPPVFSTCKISEETNKAAIALDASLQKYFTKYFSRATVQRTEVPPEHATTASGEDEEEEESMAKQSSGEGDDVPF